MATTQEYINQLKIDKQNLVSMLNNMGVEATNNETFTSLTPKVGKIVTDPILQDKAIEITENGTQTISADEGYNGLNNVTVTTNVESSGGGLSIPKVGFVFDNFDENGLPKTLNLYGYTSLANSFFYRGVNSGVSGGKPMYETVEEINFNDELTTISASAFYQWKGLKKLELKNVKTISTYAFYGNNSLISASMPNIEKISGGTQQNGAFYSNTKLKALWIGSKITSSNFGNYVFNGCSSLSKIYIDLPRATVTAMSGYNTQWGASVGTSRVICNDDANFISLEEFDAIDWANA